MAHNTYRDKGAKQSDNTGGNLSTHATYVDKGALNAQALPSNTVALTGISSTTSVGSVGIQLSSIELSGIESTASIGNVSSDAASAALTGGDVYPSILEDTLTAASRSLIITLTNDTFIADISTPIDYRGDLLDAITSSQIDNLDNFANSIAFSTTNANVVRTDSTTLTITFGTADYYELFGEDEIVSVTVPAGMLTTSTSDLDAGTFTVLASHHIALNSTITLQPIGSLTTNIVTTQTGDIRMAFSVTSKQGLVP
jgi:hypothetical protein